MSRRKYSKEFKLKVLAEHEEKGISFWKLAKNYGIEASIIRRWWHAFDAYGEEGLENTTAIFATSLRNSRGWS